MKKDNPPPLPRKLTGKQEKFIDSIMSGFTPEQAAKRAGYAFARTQVHSLLNTPSIAAELNYRRAMLARETEVTKEDVVTMFQEAYELAKTLEEPATMVRAAGELGRMLGFYEAQKLDVGIDIRQATVMKDLNQLSDDQLLQLANGAIEDAEFEEVSH